MSIIRCQNNCTYQNDGYCTLDKAISITNENTMSDNCVYYIQKGIKQKEERNELK